MTLIRGSIVSGCALVLALANGCGRSTGLGPRSSGGAGGALATGGAGGMPFGGAGGVLVTGGAGGMPPFGGAGGVLVTGGAGGVPVFGGSTATGGQGGAATARPCEDSLSFVAGDGFACPNDYATAEQWPTTCDGGHGYVGSCNGFLALVSAGSWVKECFYDPVSRVLVGAVAQDDVPYFCSGTSYTLAGGSYPSDCPLPLLADLGDCMSVAGDAGPSTGGAGGTGSLGSLGFSLALGLGFRLPAGLFLGGSLALGFVFRSLAGRVFVYLGSLGSRSGFLACHTHAHGQENGKGNNGSSDSHV